MEARVRPFLAPRVGISTLLASEPSYWVKARLAARVSLAVSCAGAVGMVPVQSERLIQVTLPGASLLLLGSDSSNRLVMAVPFALVEKVVVSRVSLVHFQTRSVLPFSVMRPLVFSTV